MITTHKLIFTFCVVSILATGLSACSGRDDSSVEKKPDTVTPDIAIPEKKIVLPENLPRDIPIYPGMQLTAAHANAEQGFFSVQGMTDDTQDQVKNFVANSPAAKGWELKNEADAMGMMYNAQFEKDGSRMLNYTLMNNNAKTAISIEARRKAK